MAKHSIVKIICSIHILGKFTNCADPHTYACLMETFQTVRVVVEFGRRVLLSRILLGNKGKAVGVEKEELMKP
ncbi:hypothetical protein ABKV19_000559 [Rosa sericea]